MNVPNILTVSRIVLSVPLFVCCAFSQWELALLLFCAASITDYVDGWWARKFHQTTVFGRIVDPFADKFLICGTFICLLGVPVLTNQMTDAVPTFFVFQPWMVIVIVARELLITTLRAVVEQSGGDFSAKWVGKWKMGLQCIAIIACFVFLSLLYHSTDVKLGFPVSEKMIDCVYYVWLLTLWGTVILTLYSGITYSVRAAVVIRGQNRNR